MSRRFLRGPLLGFLACLLVVGGETHSAEPDQVHADDDDVAHDFADREVDDDDTADGASAAVTHHQHPFCDKTAHRRRNVSANCCVKNQDCNAPACTYCACGKVTDHECWCGPGAAESRFDPSVGFSFWWGGAHCKTRLTVPPTPRPTPAPVPLTSNPTPVPTAVPTTTPTSSPTAPTACPTPFPTQSPTRNPTATALSPEIQKFMDAARRTNFSRGPRRKASSGEACELYCWDNPMLKESQVENATCPAAHDGAAIGDTLVLEYVGWFFQPCAVDAQSERIDELKEFFDLFDPHQAWSAPTLVKRHPLPVLTTALRRKYGEIPEGSAWTTAASVVGPDGGEAREDPAPPPPTSRNLCGGHGSGHNPESCNVCPACCHSWIPNGAKCDACFRDHCRTRTRSPTVAPTKAPVVQCRESIAERFEGNPLIGVLGTFNITGVDVSLMGACTFACAHALTRPLVCWPSF
jgi:hypothetical protein